MADDQPRILITGAAGFVGLRLIEALRGCCRLIAVDRRIPPPEVAGGEDVAWHQLDVADREHVARLFAEIARQGGAQVVIHLAAYYDFTGDDHPEYQRTNVGGTRHVLDACRGLGVERFVFASSLAACAFPPAGEALREITPPDGDNIYAVSKRAGEELVRAASADFPTAIVRFAALFSDWGEYSPLSIFLATWLSDAWNSRILGGRGRSAVPYLHVRDLALFMQRLIERRRDLEPAEVLIASPDGATSHRELFETATGYAFGRPRRPLLVPRVLAGPGIRVRGVLARLLGYETFERPWMARYIDLALTADSSWTRARLGWEPRPRLAILARLPFLIENMRSDPAEWHRANAEHELARQVHPNLRIAALLERHAGMISAEIDRRLRAEAAAVRHYLELSADDQAWNHRVMLRNLINAVRSRDRALFRGYCRDLGERRARLGFPLAEVRRALGVDRDVCLEALAREPDGCPPASLHEHVSVTFDFGLDALEEAYETAAFAGPPTDAGAAAPADMRRRR